MVKIRFKAIKGKYTILIPFFISYIPFITTLFLMKDIRNNYIAVGIPFILLGGVWKLLSYYIFSSYYEFSCEENKLMIKKGNDILQQILIQDISKISFSYNPEFQASIFIIYTIENQLFLAMGGIATRKKDTIKARHLITKILKPILLENSFQENIIEKGKKIVYEYVKK